MVLKCEAKSHFGGEQEFNCSNKKDPLQANRQWERGRMVADGGDSFFEKSGSRDVF